MEGEAVVSNYDILSDELLAPPRGVILIIDEAHAGKNSRAKRTKRMRAIGAAVHMHDGRRWLLTGTPQLNRDPTELRNVLALAGLATAAFGEWREFCALFDGRKGRPPRGRPRQRGRESPARIHRGAGLATRGRSA